MEKNHQAIKCAFHAFKVGKAIYLVDISKKKKIYVPQFLCSKNVSFWTLRIPGVN